MKNTILILIFVYLFASNGFSQTDSTYLGPSVFYTIGDYSSNESSRSLAFYNTLQLSKQFYLITAYDNLSIKDEESDYLQQTFLGGCYLNLFPYTLKFNYGYYKGDYSYPNYDTTASPGNGNNPNKIDELVSTDITHLFNADFIYYFDWNYLGGSYTYINQTEITPLSAHQLTLRLERILTDELFISVRPNYTRTSAGKNLFSSALKIHYVPIPELTFKVGGFLGERMFYFDSDLLLMFNQNNIQKYQAFGQIEIVPTQTWKFTFGYQHTKFDDFSINYFYAGIKANFYIK